ncbi:MAG TPA: hypothetical protein PLE80_02250, partial [Opitutaceae bacterium]|nr:hypothetical protein [Opitutaceae bacterium]
MTDSTPARDRFFELLTAAIHDGTLAKLTLGKYRGDDATLRNLFVRPIALKAGPHLSFVWRHATRDLTQNLPPAEALEKLRGLIGQTFLDAHLFTAEQTAQLQCEPQGPRPPRAPRRLGRGAGHCGCRARPRQAVPDPGGPA